MTPDKKQKKLMPNSLNKQQVRRMYWHLSNSYVTKTLHYVQIENNPHLSEEESVNRHILNNKELKHIVDIMGAPQGYSEEFELTTCRCNDHN